MRAIITGASGQDGSFLSELLLSKGYDVYGLIRQSTQFTPDKYGYLRNAIKNEKFHIEYGDVTDASGMRTLIETIQPDEVYNLAAQSHVGQSFEQPINTFTVTAQGPLNLLEAIRRSGLQTKFYEASSSEMFGKVTQTPQSEDTTFYPRSPYGCAKVFGHYITKNYREAHGIFACSGILFNHESERRGENFVTRKITRAVGRIKCGLQSNLKLGPLDIHRDWGYAPDYVKAMWMMLQHDKPDDWVIGTGVTHSIQEFVELAFKHADLDPKQYVQFDKKFVRPSEVDTLRADTTKANTVLGWKPKVSFENLVKIMVDHDIKLAKREVELSDE
jgi:GDPmannose 4,6-dehydratase